jgi:WD40 repeat protein
VLTVKVAIEKDIILRGSLDSVNVLICLSSTLLLSGGDDCCIRLWNIQSGSILRTLCGAEYPITALAYSLTTIHETEMLCIYGASGKSVVIFEKVETEGKKEDIISPSTSFEYNIDEISALALHPYEDLIACADDDGSIALVSTKTRHLIQIIKGGSSGHTSLCSCVAFLGRNVMVSGGMDGNLICHSLASWNSSSLHVASKIAEMGLEEEEDDEGTSSYPAPPKALNPPFVNGLAVSACGFFIAVCLGDGSIVIHDWDSQGHGGRPPRPLWISRPFNCAATCVGFVRHCIRSSLRVVEEEKKSVSHHSEKNVSQSDCTEEFLYAVGNDGSIILWAWGDIIAEIMCRLDEASIDRSTLSHAEEIVLVKATASFKGKHTRGPNTVTSSTLLGPCKACSLPESKLKSGVCGGQGLLFFCDTRKIITTYMLVE